MLATRLAVIALWIVALNGSANAAPGSIGAGTPSPSVTPLLGTAPVASAAPTLLQSDAARDQALMQAIERSQAQLQALGAETRAQMLSALSPAHRTLVANIFGQLIIAPNPDSAQTTRQLDAMLSPGEREAILRIQGSEISRLETMTQQMNAELQSQMTPVERSILQRQHAKQYAKLQAEQQRLSPEQRAAGERQAAQSRAMGQDPASILLRTLTTPIGWGL